MKIFSAEQLRAADAFTIANEPISSIDLMERAAGACFRWIADHFSNRHNFVIIAGKGNNGGDGFAIARKLSEQNLKVNTCIVPFFSHETPDFLENKKRLLSSENNKQNLVHEIDTPKDIVTDENTIIIDAVLGSGLSKPLEGKLAEVIQQINALDLPVISIDMPSGLPMEDSAGFDRKNIIRATFTLTFEAPKLSFFFAENAENVGEYVVLDIGIDKKYLSEQKTLNSLVTADMVNPLVRPRPKFSHKGTFGHALLISGSYGKIGAAVLGSKSCLRSGAGLLTTHIPKCGYEILQSSVPEAMVSVDEDELEFSGIKDISNYNAIGIGPGIGTSDKTVRALKMLIQQASVNLILDADALNILSENMTWLSFLRKETIITPHPGEFARLAGKSSTGYEAYQKQREFAMKYGIYVVLKGANTSIASPGGEVWFNSTGNPGMATGGSGDTLTGIILGLLAQRYPPKQAAILGVYLHGLAGDIAANEWGENSVIAGDITNCLGKAYLELESRK